MRTRRFWAAALLLGVLAPFTLALDLAMVTVGNPGNGPDMRYSYLTNFAAVSYTYQMGKYEVTAGQYTEFLNAVARTDAYGLYRMEMFSSEDGCKIDRSGDPGTYSYSVAPDWANRPVNFVSWGDAARFANWMHNGQPTTGVQDATITEDGSYRLNGATTNAALLAATRNLDATWVIPTDHEWYKAAYHKNDGPTANYWDYPTGTNVVPTAASGIQPDPGNSATFAISGGVCVPGSPYWRTEVGAHENSASPYGTFDQGGNVWEWNERAKLSINGKERQVRGGSWFRNSTMLHAESQDGFFPADENSSVGFRLALIPEPATALMVGIAGIALVRRRR